MKYLPVLTVLLLGACAQQPMRPPPPELVIIQPEVLPREVEPDVFDLMADMPGDTMLPPLGGEVEQIDCRIGSEDLQARMAVDARGGHIASFAYYSKWRPYTCSMDMRRDDPAIKWRLTADGDTRVQTPFGAFLIRINDEAFVFEFQDVDRQKFCGMDDYTNGTMTVKRDTDRPECSVAGLMDRAGYVTAPEFAAERPQSFAERVDGQR